MLCLQGHCLLDSVVSEGVPQENEDEDDAGGCQRRAGDVKQPRCLGIFHGSIQVIQELLVPNLEAEGGGREAEVRGGSGWRSAEKERQRSVQEEEVKREQKEASRRDGMEASRGERMVVIGGEGREAEAGRGGRTEASRVMRIEDNRGRGTEDNKGRDVEASIRRVQRSSVGIDRGQLRKEVRVSRSRDGS